MPNMAEPSCIYDLCSTKELKAMFRARKASRVPAPKTKELLISRLKKSKRSDRTFRFLDLPAEMRNEVYTELLSFRSETKKKCWPEILSTCRQVHDEAQGLIYLINEFDVKFSVQILGQYRTEFTIDSNGIDVPMSADWRLLKGPLAWPPYLQKAHTLRLSLSVEGNRVRTFTPTSARRKLWKPTQALCDLTDFLAGHQCLEVLEVDCSFDQAVPDDLFERFVLLTRYIHASRRTASIRMMGVQSCPYEDKLIEEDFSKSILSQIRQCRELDHEVESLRQICQRAVPSEGYPMDEISHEQVELGSGLTNYLIGVGDNDSQVRESVRRLERMIRGVDIERIEEGIQELEGMKEAFKLRQASMSGSCLD